MAASRDAASPADATGSPGAWGFWSYGRAALLLLAALLAFFGPPLARGKVLHPYDNSAEVGLHSAGLDRITRVFSTEVTLYIPEIQAHLNCPHASWLATWNPHNELGRPLLPCGIGRTYILGNLLSLLTSDPFFFYTWMAIFSVVGTAAFAFLFFRALALHPLACLVGATGISIGPIYSAWPAMPIVQWGYCFSFAALWGIELWLRRPSLWTWLWLAFAVHSVLLCGYMQHVLLLGWITASWLVFRTFELRSLRRERTLALLGIAAAALVGLLSVAPVWLDLYLDWRDSVRADYSSPPGAAVLDTPAYHARFWLGLVSVVWPGDSGNQSQSLSPLFAGLGSVALLSWRRHRAWLWFGWTAIAIAATNFPLANLALRGLGLVLSDWAPIFGGLLPATVLAALGADRLLRSSAASRTANVAACLAPLLLAALFAPRVEFPFDRNALLLAIVLGLGVCAFAWRPMPLLLLGLLAVVVIDNGRVFVRWQPREKIQAESPLSEAVRARTADGSRFAWVGPRPDGQRFFLPNVEILLDLASIHSFDHLMSRAFTAWARKLGPPSYSEAVYERSFRQIADLSRIHEEFLALSGVSTILSLSPPDPALAEQPLLEGSVHVSSLRNRGPLEALLPPGDFTLPGDGQASAAPDRIRAHTALQRKPTGGHDRLRFEFPPAQGERLLFVSQQYDERWKARARGLDLATVRVDGMYQGALIPAGVEEVDLAFEPWSLYSIVPQLFFALAGLAGCIVALWRRRNSAGFAIAL